MHTTAWGWQRVSGLGFLAAGLSVATLGVIFTVDYINTRDKLFSDSDALCKKGLDVTIDPCGANGAHKNEFAKLQSDADTNERTATLRLPLAYGGAAALVGAGLVLVLTAPKREAQGAAPHVRIVPQIGAGTLLLNGTF